MQYKMLKRIADEKKTTQTEILRQMIEYFIPSKQLKKLMPKEFQEFEPFKIEKYFKWSAHIVLRTVRPKSCEPYLGVYKKGAEIDCRSFPPPSKK